MADAGAIARTFRFIDAVRFPAYAGNQIAYRLEADGAFGGTVTESGTPVHNAEVWVIWRPTMRPIARTFTDADGAWYLTGFDPALTDKYSVVVKDPPGGTAYNDAIYALVVPV